MLLLCFVYILIFVVNRLRCIYTYQTNPSSPTCLTAFPMLMDDSALPWSAETCDSTTLRHQEHYRQCRHINMVGGSCNVGCRISLTGVDSALSVIMCISESCSLSLYKKSCCPVILLRPPLHDACFAYAFLLFF